MTVPAIELASSELSNGGVVATRTSSDSRSSTGSFSDQLNQKISDSKPTNNQSKEQVKSDNKKIGKHDVSADAKPAGETPSRQKELEGSDSDRLTTASEDQTIPPNHLPGGKTLPDTAASLAAMTPSILQDGVVDEISDTVDGDDEFTELQQLIRQFSQGVRLEGDKGSQYEQFHGASQELAALPVALSETHLGLQIKQAFQSHRDSAGQSLMVAMDTIEQKMTTDLPQGLSRLMEPLSSSRLFGWSESESLTSQVDLVFANNGTVGRFEPATAYTNPLANPLTEVTTAGLDKMILDRPITHARWSQDLGERVQWMMNRSMSGAEIRLNPPQLGPIEIRIQINQDQASVAFASQHANVREAIESALPRLRDMLGQQSMNLANVDISQHSFSDQRQQGQLDDHGSGHSMWSADSESEGVSDEALTPLAGPVHDGLINTYV